MSKDWSGKENIRKDNNICGNTTKGTAEEKASIFLMEKSIGI